MIDFETDSGRLWASTLEAFGHYFRYLVRHSEHVKQCHGAQREHQNGGSDGSGPEKHAENVAEYTFENVPIGQPFQSPLEFISAPPKP